MLDFHISILGAKLSYILSSHKLHKDISYNYEKKLEIIRNEIAYASEQRRKLLKLKEDDYDDDNVTNEKIDMRYLDFQNEGFVFDAIS